MLSNKVIWISGGSTGIGKSTAIKFVEKNWIVVVTARNKDNLQKLKEEINNKFKMNKFYIFTCDNTIKDQVESISLIKLKVKILGQLSYSFT